MPKPSDPAFPDLFPRGTFVVIVGNAYGNLYGRYQGNAGKRYDGQKHRVKLTDGRIRYVAAGQLVRPGRWEPVGGLLHRWTLAERVEDLHEVGRSLGVF